MPSEGAFAGAAETVDKDAGAFFAQAALQLVDRLVAPDEVIDMGDIGLFW